MPSGRDKLLRAETMLQASEVETRRASERGAWFPLSVWAARGYDVTLIKSMSSADDQKQHPIFGKVYRVWEHTDEHAHEKSLSKTDTLRKHKAREAPTPSAAGPLAIEDADKSDSDSSSGSTSSSSKKKKKSKKAKKAKKAKKEKKAKVEARNPLHALGMDG